MADETQPQQKQQGRRGGRFTIQADHPRNSDLLVQSLINVKLRSTIKASRTVKDAKTGVERVPIDQAQGLGQYPEIPGMTLAIDVKNLTYVVSDPLTKKPELCKQILAARNQQSGTRSQSDLGGVPTAEGKVDANTMKTLCREVAHMIKNKHVRVLDGAAPSIEQCDDIDGRYINNIGSPVPNSQPRYEDQMEGWVDNLHSVGG